MDKNVSCDRFKQDDFQPAGVADTSDCYACGKSHPLEEMTECVICDNKFCSEDIDGDFRGAGMAVCNMCETSEHNKIFNYMTDQLHASHRESIFWQKKFLEKTIELKIARGE